MALAIKGSRRWIQLATTSRRDLLSRELRAALGLGSTASIDWVSPMPPKYNELRDGAALRAVGLSELPAQSLSSFWPRRGPVWDAIGLIDGHEPVFVEAKAHIPEAASPATAAGADSVLLIRRSLSEARRYYAPRAKGDWSGTFYQYANRLAHHYWLRKVNGVRSHLVFVYFINDVAMGGPKTVQEWRGAIRLLHAALGLPADLSKRGVHEVFLDVQSLR
jgi:hypothetical protein